MKIIGSVCLSPRYNIDCLCGADYLDMKQRCRQIVRYVMFGEVNMTLSETNQFSGGRLIDGLWAFTTFGQHQR